MWIKFFKKNKKEIEKASHRCGLSFTIPDGSIVIHNSEPYFLCYISKHSFSYWNSNPVIVGNYFYNAYMVNSEEDFIAKFVELELSQ